MLNKITCFGIYLMISDDSAIKSTIAFCILIGDTGMSVLPNSVSDIS